MLRPLCASLIKNPEAYPSKPKYCVAQVVYLMLVQHSSTHSFESIGCMYGCNMVECTMDLFRFE